jgi:hypothetical protein
MTIVNEQAVQLAWWLSLIMGCFLLSVSPASLADETAGDKANHLALIIGHAEEEQSDGHFESGSVLGLDYIRHVAHRWGLGATFEMETFGNNQKRHGILVMPVSYYPGGNWRLFAAPGVEFSEPWKPDKAILRIGASYSFHLTGRLSLAPEAQIDFVEGGSTVYVFALAFGVAF